MSIARRYLRILSPGVLLLVASGCALHRKNVVPESVATCRELSREGVSAMESGQWQRAETLFADAVSASPTDADARRNLAETLWQQGMQREAVVHIETAVRLDPLHGPTIVRSGEMLFAMGAPEKSMQRAEEAIRLDPTLAGGWALRGRIYRQQGNPTRALADLQQSLRYASRDRTVLNEVAQIQYQLGKHQNCLSTLHCLLDNYSPGEEPQQALWLEGLAYKRLGRYNEAVESLHSATLRGQPRADLLYELAQAERAAGQGTAAADSLRLALSLDSDHQPSRILLAQLQQVDTALPGEVLRR